jgi:hypothetical protein
MVATTNAIPRATTFAIEAESPVFKMWQRYSPGRKIFGEIVGRTEKLAPTATSQQKEDREDRSRKEKTANADSRQQITSGRQQTNPEARKWVAASLFKYIFAERYLI